MNKRAFAFPVVFLASVTSPAAAPRVLATSGDWGVYSYQRDGKKLCYALSVPKEAEPAGVDHGNNYFLIAPAQGADRKEPEVIAGYPLKAGSMIEVSIGPKTFRMFTKDNTGWVNNTSRAPELMQAMRSGRTMVLQAVSARGTHTRYSYSLDGISKALDLVSHCK